MLVQRCKLDEHRLVIPISITKHYFGNGDLAPNSFSDSTSFAEYRALVDTGATRSVVSHKVIGEQQLMRTGHMQFNSMHGAQTHTRYLASIGFWVERTHNPPASDYSESEKTFYLHQELIEPVNMNDNANFDVIIGFDVLKYYSFEFDHHQVRLELQFS